MERVKHQKGRDFGSSRQFISNFVIFCAFNATMSLINEKLAPHLNEYFHIRLSLVNFSQKLLSKFGSFYFNS